MTRDQAKVMAVFGEMQAYFMTLAGVIGDADSSAGDLEALIGAFPHPEMARVYIESSRKMCKAFAECQEAFAAIEAQEEGESQA